MQQQVRELKKKAKQWADKVRTNHITKGEAWYVLKSIIMKTIYYPLMATTMTEKELNSIMLPIFKAAIPKAHVQSCMPNTL